MIEWNKRRRYRSGTNDDFVRESKDGNWKHYQWTEKGVIYHDISNPGTGISVIGYKNPGVAKLEFQSRAKQMIRKLRQAIFDLEDEVF